MAWNNNVKVEGRPFDRIKELVAAKKKAHKEAMLITEEAHDTLWKAIHEEFPQLDKDASLTLDVEYEKMGFYIVKESEGRGLGGLLSAMKAAMKD